MQIFQRYIAILSFTFTCLYSHAAIPPQQLVLEAPKAKAIADTKKEIEIVAKIIPTNLQPGQTEEQISLRVIDHSMQTFTADEYFRNSEIGKAATNFEKSLNTDMNLGGDSKKGEVTHSVNMQVLAFEQKAWVRYKGITEIQVTYRAEKNILDMELTEDLGGSAKLVITHNVQDQFSRANISWNW